MWVWCFELQMLSMKTNFTLSTLIQVKVLGVCILINPGINTISNAITWELCSCSYFGFTDLAQCLAKEKRGSVSKTFCSKEWPGNDSPTRPVVSRCFIVGCTPFYALQSLQMWISQLASSMLLSRQSGELCLTNSVPSENAAFVRKVFTFVSCCPSYLLMCPQAC